MKQKMVVITPPTPWAKRGPTLENKGHKKNLIQKSWSVSNAIDFETHSPSDIHLFYEIYSEEDPNFPFKLFYKILGSTALPDLEEYEDSVTQVDFAGRISSIDEAFEVVRRLKRCANVTFVLGDNEQRECYIVGEEADAEKVGSPIPHVTQLQVLFPSKDHKHNKKFLPYAEKQIKRIFRQARYNLPNLETIKISLTGVESYRIVKEYLPYGKNLKYNYDVQIVKDTVSLSTSPRELPELDSSPMTEELLDEAEEMVDEIIEKLDKSKPPIPVIVAQRPILIPTEPVEKQKETSSSPKYSEDHKSKQKDKRNQSKERFDKEKGRQKDTHVSEKSHSKPPPYNNNGRYNNNKRHHSKDADSSHHPRSRHDSRNHSYRKRSKCSGSKEIVESSSKRTAALPRSDEWVNTSDDEEYMEFLEYPEDPSYNARNIINNSLELCDDVKPDFNTIKELVPNYPPPNYSPPPPTTVVTLPDCRQPPPPPNYPPPTSEVVVVAPPPPDWVPPPPLPLDEFDAQFDRRRIQPSPPPPLKLKQDLKEIEINAVNKMLKEFKESQTLAGLPLDKIIALSDKSCIK